MVFFYEMIWPLTKYFMYVPWVKNLVCFVYGIFSSNCGLKKEQLVFKCKPITSENFLNIFALNTMNDVGLWGR